MDKVSVSLAKRHNNLERVIMIEDIILIKLGRFLVQHVSRREIENFSPRFSPSALALGAKL